LEADIDVLGVHCSRALYVLLRQPGKGNILREIDTYTLKVWSWPLFHLFEFFLSRTNFDTGVDAIGGERSSALDVPFIEDCFLDFWDTADEIVEAFSVCIR
jgi:hypothetical protein